MGCRLNVTSILTHTTGAFPAPFASFLGGAPGNLRVAPVLIGRNQSPDGLSDVIAVMSGSGAAGGVSRRITGTAGGSTAVLDNVVGFSTSDLVLVSQSGTPDCLLEEVASINTPNLTFGSIYNTPGTTTTLASLVSSTSSYVTPLGNAAIGSYSVQFVLIGVDANHTLYSYDLLRNQSLVQSPGSADAAQAIADGVYQIHAIYGVDTTPNGNGTQDAWAGPGDAHYDINSLMASANYMENIVSVRIGLVVRGEYYDKRLDPVTHMLTPVSPSTFTLFQGLKNAAGVSLQQPVTLNAAAGDQQYRYRVFEFTVPLRNMIMLAGGP
jgi:type IV pilus assembly protein PilW